MSKKRGKRRGFPGLSDLSRAPESSWPDGAIHHGARIGVLVALAVAITFLLPPAPRPSITPYEVGNQAVDDVTAQIPFDVPEDQEEVARAQAAREATTPPTFEYRAAERDTVEQRLNGIFARLTDIADAEGQSGVQRFLREQSILVEPGQEAPLLEAANRQALHDPLQDVVRELMPLYLDAGDAHYLTTDQIRVHDPTGTERRQRTDSILVGQAFFNRAMERVRPFTSEMEDLFRLFGFRFFQSPYQLDLMATDSDRRQARESVEPTRESVLVGQSIVREGDLIGQRELERLEAYERALRAQGLLQDESAGWPAVLGSALLNLLLLSVFGLLLFFFRREVYKDFRWVLLLGFLVLAYFLAGAGISWQGFRWELLPVAFAVLPVAILWDGRMALILALLLAVLTGAQAPFNEFNILVVTLVGGAAAALSARAVRRRAQTWIFIALITLAYGAAILALGLINRSQPTDLLASVLISGANATFSAILAMGFVPVFEWFTGITTDQTLLEWADPNRPLLKRLSLEASGTYAHTINVANLAEAAASAIGANGLLTRVGIYYHDVGKMLKPHFFVENQPGGRNPHDKLKPRLSASIVREHVVEGERLALEEGVPEVVTQFIPEHHGTQLIGFFYEKALEEEAEEPDQAEFRYPGPKPRSKETAIAMLADSVESATRALQDPSSERVRELVRTIVDGKIRDGQLAESPLTLREIDVIQGQFAKVIAGMYHHRLDYPATKHITESQDQAAEGTENEAEPQEVHTDHSASESPEPELFQPLEDNPEQGS